MLLDFYLFVTLLWGQLSLFFRFTYMTTIEKFSLLRKIRSCLNLSAASVCVITQDIDSV
jgi:hypothetical protein